MSAPAAGFPRLLALGDAAFSVEFGAGIAPETHARVLGFAAALADCAIPGVIERVPTFRSVTVHFDPDLIDPPRLAADLLALAHAGHEAAASGRRWVLPVCFDDALAPDLPDVAAHCGLAREAVIERLCATEFSAYMLGFLPGFAYLGGLPAALEMPRGKPASGRICLNCPDWPQERPFLRLFFIFNIGSKSETDVLLTGR